MFSLRHSKDYYSISLLFLHISLILTPQLNNLKPIPPRTQNCKCILCCRLAIDYIPPGCASVSRKIPYSITPAMSPKIPERIPLLISTIQQENVHPTLFNINLKVYLQVLHVICASIPNFKTLKLIHTKFHSN